MMTPSHATPVLRAVRLNRTFNDGVRVRHALREVSVNLYPGQLALLMGPSGSGKSTLLAVLSGLLKPDSGQIFAQDQGNTVDLWSLKDAEREQFRLRHTGFIFQGYNLFPAFSARQQLEIVLKWGNNMPGGEARELAEDMLNRLGLEAQKNKKPAQLSGGEKQRVAIGRALVKNPQFLFCDEPTSALDVSVQAQILNLLKDLQQELGLTMLFISHDLPVIRQMCDRIGVMQHGHLVEVAETEKLFTNAEHEYSRKLISLMPEFKGMSREGLEIAS